MNSYQNLSNGTTNIHTNTFEANSNKTIANPNKSLVSILSIKNHHSFHTRIHTQREHDAIWIIVDRLTKSAHFLPVKLDYTMDRLAELYVSEIFRLHGIPLSIVSDHDPRFTLRF